ncbi:MAG: ribbon-helix-helix protein, CopG family [Gloeocapsa sp. UFS-A4-WI-NPMV-4B04]|nr:ribbon-helix-helix protein, CopG family [Gloeocapsa sp. UFS-A4-WI-NPMV-4B04]
MTKKWAAQRKNVNLTEEDLADLEQVCKITRRTESEVLREALRHYAKQIKAELVAS